MVYCVQAYLIFADTATRNTRLAQATSFVTNKERWDVTTLEPLGSDALVITARFISKSDQLSVDAASRNLGGAQPGSWVQIHDCTHDEGSNSCSGNLVRTEF